MSFLTGPGTSFLTYLGHYTLARLLYDEVVRPLGLGGAGLAVVAVTLLLLRRRTRGRR